MTTIYKLCPAELWRVAVDDGVFRGSAVDLRDGFIHFSTADQVKETAARYFAGAAGLVLVAFDDASLGAELRYEPSRDGALFPHLHAPLDPKAALWVEPLPIGPDGVHAFPDLPP